MKKVVFKLDLHDNEGRRKALKKASSVSGVDSLSLDKDQKLTMTGDFDPVVAVSKLRKLCHTEILSVGPAKEPEKKNEEPKKYFAGVDSVSMDKDHKLTVTGDVDPVLAVRKTEILSVGPAKEPEKKNEEPKKEEPKKPAEVKKGVDSVSMDKDHKLTVTEDVDPVLAVRKTEILSVGSAKEPEKKNEEPKKEEPKKPAEVKKGVDSVLMDKDHKLTVTGDVDPVPEPEKKIEEPKKEEPKKPAKVKKGVDSVYMDKDHKLTMTEDVDPVVVVRKTEILSVGPANEPEKKNEAPAEVKKDPSKEPIAYPYIMVCHPPMPAYYPPVPDYYTYGKSVEEDSAGCVIC